MPKAIAPSFHKPKIATHFKSHNDRLFCQTPKCLKRSPFIPQTNDRNSPQPKQRSPISSDNLNVQRDRSLIPQTNDRSSSQTKQRSPIFSDQLNT
ncbi:MAG: hypothetical protein ACOYMQ_13535 [Pseudanabaena sp.]